MICPLTKKPCDQPKAIHVTEMTNGQYNEMELCHQCAGAFLQGPPPSMLQNLELMHPATPEQLPNHPMTFFTNPKLLLAAIFQQAMQARNQAKEVICPA